MSKQVSKQAELKFGLRKNLPFMSSHGFGNRDMLTKKQIGSASTESNNSVANGSETHWFRSKKTYRSRDNRLTIKKMAPDLPHPNAHPPTRII